MGKKKKVPEKLRLYYKGAATPPTRVANEQDMVAIVRALEECLPNKSSYAFRYSKRSDAPALKFVVGLKAGLRCLKQNRTKAIIYDDTASVHVTKFLNLFAAKQAIPIIQAHKLIDHASKVSLKTLMMVSLVHIDIPQDLYKEGDPRPKPVERVVDKCLAFDQLYLLFVRAEVQDKAKKVRQLDQISYQMPELDQVPSSGRSKAKKEAKKATPKKKKKEREKPRADKQ